MEIKKFEQYVKQAVLEVPTELRQAIKNLAFVVEENIRPALPSREKPIKSRGILLGLYQGIPLPKRSGYYSGALPDKITIFKQAIERVAGPNEKSIKKRITEVVHHEIGHYFGMDEKTVRAWEQKRKKL